MTYDMQLSGACLDLLSVKTTMFRCEKFGARYFVPRGLLESAHWLTYG